MPNTFEVANCTVIQRPIDEVRAQYGDIQYHATHHVHDGITFNVIEQSGDTTRYESVIPILGQPRTDVATIHTTADGSVESNTIEGPNAGARLTFRFKQLDETSTEVSSTVTGPVPGVFRLLGGLYAFGARKALEKASLEDKRDLESGRYAEYRNAQRVSV